MRSLRTATLLVLGAVALVQPPADAAAKGRPCVACPRPIPQYGTWGTYTIDGTKYLIHTDDPEPAQCRYCSGLMTPYGPWGQAVKYADGRQVCRRCFATAINDPKTAQAVMNQVRRSMTSWGMRFPWREIPVALVGQSTLVRLIARQHPGMMPNGICQPELRKRFMSDRWEVTSLKIHMLTGLPRVHYEKTAAHELMHAWSALNGCPKDQAPAFREGAANLAAYYYLQTRGGAEADKVKRQMLEEDDPTYGEGLRRHIRYATAHRVRGMLAILKTHHDFPQGY